jgi:hypothetical protein
MKTIKTNIWDIKVGDIILVNYSNGNTKEMKVDKVTESSWYFNGCRNSFNTLNRLLNNCGDVSSSKILKH